MSFQHEYDCHQQFQQKKIIRSNKEYKINGVRPTALQLHNSSHVIHKSSASSSSSSVSTACSSTSPSNKNHQRNGPVIIYTHSPKVIHTQPRDFMALVQKLTGLSASNFEQTHQREMEPLMMQSACKGERSNNEMGCGVVQDLNLDYGLSSRNKFDKNDNRSFLSEIPLFTPTGFDTFRSPPAHQQQQFRFPGDPIFSPATLEFLKLLPEC